MKSLADMISDTVEENLRELQRKRDLDILRHLELASSVGAGLVVEVGCPKFDFSESDKATAIQELRYRLDEDALPGDLRFEYEQESTLQP